MKGGYFTAELLPLDLLDIQWRGMGKQALWGLDFFLILQ